MKYTFSDDDDSDDFSARRSNRNSGVSTPLENQGPTVTSSGRHVKSRLGGIYGESLPNDQRRELEAENTGAAEAGTETSEDMPTTLGRPERSTRPPRNAQRPSKYSNGGHSDVESEEAPEQEEWSGDEDAPDDSEPDFEVDADEDDDNDNEEDSEMLDEEDDLDEHEDENTQESLVVQLRYKKNPPKLEEPQEEPAQQPVRFPMTTTRAYQDVPVVESPAIVAEKTTNLAYMTNGNGYDNVHENGYNKGSGSHEEKHFSPIPLTQTQPMQL